MSRGRGGRWPGGACQALPLALGTNNSNLWWSAPLAFQEDAEQAVMTQVLPGLGHGHSGGRPALDVAAGQLAGDPDLPPAGILPKL